MRFSAGQRSAGSRRTSAAGPRAFLTDATACLAGQDRARDDTEEVIGALRERGLIVEPRKCRDQRKQVSAVDVGPRYARGVSALESPRACLVQRDARRIECGLRVLHGGRQQRRNTPVLMGERDAVAEPRNEGILGGARRFAVGCLCRQLVDGGAEQGLEQRLSRREVTVQRAEPDARSAGNVAQRRLSALLGHAVALAREQAVVVLPGVGSHMSPGLVSGAVARISGALTRLG